MAAATTLRMRSETLQALRNEYAKTYPIHRLSLNAWLLSRIQLSFTLQGEDAK